MLIKKTEYMIQCNIIWYGPIYQSILCLDIRLASFRIMLYSSNVHRIHTSEVLLRQMVYLKSLNGKTVTLWLWFSEQNVFAKTHLELYLNPKCYILIWAWNMFIQRVFDLLFCLNYLKGYWDVYWKEWGGGASKA